MEDRNDWDSIVDTYRVTTEHINKKISKFNLVVPVLNKQMVLVNLSGKATSIIINGKYSKEGRIKISRETNDTKVSNLENIFSFIDGIFKK